jgi:serine/threonine-protein kinase
MTLDEFVQRLMRSRLLSAEQLATFQDSLPSESRPQDGEALARELVRAKRLTKYQATAVYQGKTRGLILGDYVVLDRIGAGGMGQVYKAEHRRMGRIVAVKILPSRAIGSPESIRRFQREVRAAAKLIHPNIVTAFDAGEAEGIHYLVMEFVDGRDLATLIKESGGLPMHQAVACVLQAARGLEYAHGEGVVHRDIKPANLLLDKRGTVKILDMGLARLEEAFGPDNASGPDRLTCSGQMMGTCDYMAPEQALNTHKADRRADIYSLGCTMYRLLTGKPPYEGMTVVEILLAHRERPIPLLRQIRPEMPPALEAICQKMMAKQPEDRYSSMTEVVEAIQACVPASPATPANMDWDALQGPALGSGSAWAVPGTEGRETPRLAEGEETETKGSRRPGRVRRENSPAKRFGAGVGVAGLLLAMGLIVFLRSGSNQKAAGPGPGPARPTPAASIDSPLPRGADGLPPKAVAPFGAKRARQYQEAWASYLGVPVEMTNSIGMEFVLIPPGEFMMGSTPAQIKAALDRLKPLLPQHKGHKSGLVTISAEGPQHRVKLNTPFYCGIYEVTQAQYRQVMGVNPSGYAPKGERAERVVGFDTEPFPVDSVSLDDVGEFCRRLSESAPEKAAGRKYELPTEAQWEYACRAGTTTDFSFGDDENDLCEHAWIRLNSNGRTHRVGEKLPNPFGLYDMLGNVYEWCADGYTQDWYSRSPVDDPIAPSSFERRANRGGCWSWQPVLCRSAVYGQLPRDSRQPGGGFRVVLLVTEVPREEAAANAAGSR